MVAIYTSFELYVYDPKTYGGLFFAICDDVHDMEMSDDIGHLWTFSWKPSMAMELRIRKTLKAK